MEVPGNNQPRMAEFFSTYQFCWTLPAPKKKPARAMARSGPEVSDLPLVGGLFDFDVIAGVDSDRTVGDQHGRRVAAHVDDDAFAEHFAR